MFLVAATVSMDSLHGDLHGASIDVPRPGSWSNSKALPVAGWVLGRSHPIRTVDLSSGGSIVRRVVPHIHRPDVAAHFESANALQTGFETSIDVSEASIQQIDVTARLRTGTLVAIGSIGLRRFWHSGSHPSEAGVVSIVVTCFNQACFLGEAIESCLRQRYPKIEIVVIDDGSTDNTSEVAARYPGVTYVHQNNQGVAAARNTGIRRSNGEFVMFLDADDRLAEDAVATNVTHLQSRHECAFVSGEHCYIGIDGLMTGQWTRTTLNNAHYIGLLRGNYIGCPAAVTFRRSVFRVVGNFDPHFQPCEDYEMYLRIARQFPVTAHSQLVAEYRKYGSSISADPSRMLRAALAVLRRHGPQPHSAPDTCRAVKQGRRYWRAYYGHPLASLARDKLRRRGLRFEGLRAAWQLMRLAPAHFLRVFSTASPESPN